MTVESIDHNKNKCNNGDSAAAGALSWSKCTAWRDEALPVPLLRTWQAAVIVAITAAVCFSISLRGEFVFDDSEAIVNNRDLLPENPWWNAFRNDFWGTRLTHNNSHKSYRPLTVVSFRINYWLSGGLRPWGFHLTNVVLHAVVSMLSIPVFAALLDGANDTSGTTSRSAFLCALLFAVHPIHTECVAGVVGRADLLCALFFFMAFLLYVRATEQELHGVHPKRSSIAIVIVSMILCAISMLCKEQGITVIGLCSAYDIIIVCQVDLNKIFRVQLSNLPSISLEKLGKMWQYSCKFSEMSELKQMDWSSEGSEISKSSRKLIWLQRLLLRHTILTAAGILFISVRWHIMGSSPIFQKVDNPASYARTVYERVINYNYIYALNAWLLVAPIWLCFDWSMGCIPLVNSIWDSRISVVLILWIFLGALGREALLKLKSQEHRSLSMALALLIIPFLPATNVFFTVGFVIAERVLYISSAGFCMLVVIGLRKLCSTFSDTKIIQVSIVLLIVIFILRCNQRTADWKNEEALFRSGLKVCPLNAKVHYNIAKNAADAGNKNLAIQEYRESIRLNPMYDQAMNNLANILKDQGQLKEAENLLIKATSLRADFAAAWMNLGIVQSSLKKHGLAEKSYLTALSYRHRYPDCHYNLGNLYLDQQRFGDAYRSWRNATRLKPTHTVSWNNMIIMLDNQGELEKAEAVALEALQILPNEASLHFNLANTLGKAGRFHESEEHFLKAIQQNPHNPTYFTNLGVLYHRGKKYDKAEKAYRQALQLNPTMKSAKENLNLLLKTTTKQRVVF